MELPLCETYQSFMPVKRRIDERSGPTIFLGGLLLLITSILEFVLGNTFPCVVFGTIGKYSDISTAWLDSP